MAPPRNNKDNLTLSVLDRLIDLDPRSSAEAHGAQVGGLDELKQSVRRDLEWLLNTRRMVTDVSDTLEEMQKSVVMYGLPDFTGTNVQNDLEATSLQRTVEQTIRIFEPRFLDVKATLEPITQTERQIRFRIEARLDLDPVPEPMVFDTVLQLGSGEFSVKEGSTA